MRQQPESLLVDMAAAPLPPPDADLLAFLNDQRVFISSTMVELKDERASVAGVVTEVGATPVWFEEFGGRDDDPEAAYLSEVRSSTIYVGLLGKHYGKFLPSRFSATHEEYREAEGSGLRISVWTIASGDWDGDQERFVQEVRTFHTTGSFGSSDDLARSLKQRLLEIASQELSPWCKLGRVVFRASHIRIGATGIEVVARVQGADVADALEAMRPNGWQSGPHQFTDPSRSISVRVREVSTFATSARGRELTIRLESVDANPDVFSDMSFSNGDKHYTADDLTEAALREQLFGESNPAGSFVSLPNPLAALPSGLSEEILRPIMRLLLTEVLVGSGRASRLVKMQLGVPIRGARQFVLEWEGSTRLDQAAERRIIQGPLNLGSEE